MFLMIPRINRDYFLEQLYHADLCNGGSVFSVLYVVAF
jgi:hypothetical protein